MGYTLRVEIDLAQRLDVLEKKVEATYAAAEKTRTYILVMLVVTLGAVILPLIGLLFAIPSMLSVYSQIGSI